MSALERICIPPVTSNLYLDPDAIAKQLGVPIEKTAKGTELIVPGERAQWVRAQLRGAGIEIQQP